MKPGALQSHSLQVTGIRATQHLENSKTTVSLIPELPNRAKDLSGSQGEGYPEPF